MAGLVAVPVAGAPHPVARTQPSGAASATAGPALTISVSDGRTAVKTGDQLTYLITVRDGGPAGAPHLAVTQTLSPGLDFLSAVPRATAAGRRVTWPAAIPAGGTRAFRVVARVTRTPARQLRLSAVACASGRGSSRPIVCAAHLDRLPAAAPEPASRPARQAGIPPLAYAGAALAVLAAAVLAVLARRRARLRRQAG